MMSSSWGRQAFRGTAAGGSPYLSGGNRQLRPARRDVHPDETFSGFVLPTSRLKSTVPSSRLLSRLLSRLRRLWTPRTCCPHKSVESNIKK
jgi:hypothetical protein